MEDITPTSQIERVSTAPEVSQIEQAINHSDLLTQYVSRILKEGIDYGAIPRGKKPILF